MKIGIICASMTMGGAERVGVMLANGFATHGHDVSLITDIYLKQTYSVAPQVKKIALNPPVKNKILRWLGAIYNIRRYVKREKPDAIIGIMALCSFVARIACLGTRVPVIMTEHDAYQRIPSEALTKMEVFSKYYLDKIYPQVTILTEADKIYIGNRLKNITVMPNPSTFSIFDGKLEKEKIILAAGRLSNWHCKGFDFLIEAWGEIADKFPEWRLQIAGTGAKEDFDYLKSLAEKYKVSDRIDFLGYRTDMLELYRKAAIYVLSSRSEGLPMVVIEAMGQGCACVAVENLGRTKEIIRNEQEGLLCEMENPVDLAEKMCRMISDENLRTVIQKNSIERAKYYSLDHIIALWENLLSRIVR